MPLLGAGCVRGGERVPVPGGAAGCGAGAGCCELAARVVETGCRWWAPVSSFRHRPALTGVLLTQEHAGPLTFIVLDWGRWILCFMVALIFLPHDIAGSIDSIRRITVIKYFFQRKL